MIYLDTNIFLYATDKTSAFYSPCDELINAVVHGKLTVATSAETIQEIVNYLRNIREGTKAVKTAFYVIKAVREIIPVDGNIINVYLSLLKKYPSYKKVSSRDFLHAATCIVYKIGAIITYDADFKKFKEVKTMTPEQFLKRYL